jgi:hypothetical protein
MNVLARSPKSRLPWALTFSFARAPNGLFAVEAILFFLRNLRIVECDAALLGDALADLVNIESGNTIGSRHGEMGAEHQDRWKNHGFAPWNRRFPL